MKKALLSAAISIMLCLSLVTGATMALFTSESKVNIAVSSGKVDVVASVADLYIKDLNEATYTRTVADGETGNFESVGADTRTLAFNGNKLTFTNLVPGDSAKFNVKVTNNSTVTTKYRVCISSSGELFSGLVVTVDDKAFLGQTYSAWKTLTVGTNGDTVAVEIALPNTDNNTHDNKYQGKACDIEVTVQAIQGNAETFNDTNAGVVVETNADSETAAAATISANGFSVAIPAGTKLEAGATTTTFVVKKDTENTGNFSFGGESLALNISVSEVADDNDSVMIVTLENCFPHKPVSVAMFHEGVMMAPVATLGEVDVADEYYYNSNNGTVVFATDNFSNFTLAENVKVVTTEKELYDVAFSQNKKYNNVHNVVVANDITITKKIQVADGRGDLIVDLNGNTLTTELTSEMFLNYAALTVKNGTLEVASKALANGKGDVTLENVTVEAGNLGTSLFNAGYTLTLTDVEINVNNFKVNGGSFISINGGTKAVFTNTTFNIGLDTTYTAYFINRSADNVTMSGCTYNIVDANGFAYDVVRKADSAVNDKYGFAQNNKWSGKVSTAWYTEDATSYTIANGMELAGLAQLVNSGISFQGKTVTLANDIDLNNVEWTPIGKSKSAFSGIFDGNNNTISNLTITGNTSYVGLFGFTTNGEVKNLTVENASVSGRVGVGVVAGSPYTSKYTDITVKGDIKVEGMSYVGGVGGRNAYANWTNVTVNANEGSYVKANSVEYDPSSEYADGEGYVTYRTYVGGVVGFMGEGGHVFTNVTSNINVSGSTCDVGGIVGIAHYNNKFVNCSSSGTVELWAASDAADAEEIGGIAGVWHNESGTTVTFEGCTFTGKLIVNVEGVDLSDNTITGKAYTSSGTGELIVK